MAWRNASPHGGARLAIGLTHPVRLEKAGVQSQCQAVGLPPGCTRQPKWCVVFHEPNVLSGSAENRERDATILVTLASGGRIEELLFALPNWWEHFNWKWDHPVLVFHQNLTQHEVALIRNASQNRVWFANIDRYFRQPEKLPQGPDRLQEADIRAGYRLMCRFKATYVLDQPALQGFRWMLWMDSDSYFTDQVPNDFAKEMRAAGAIFGYTHTGMEDAPLIKYLFDAALLFEATELGGSKGRPPAALEEEERK